nr:uncharacterized protein LOC119180633 [Rhipicephalus microplus]
MQNILVVGLAMIAVSSSQDCEDNNGKYFAFHNITLVGDETTYPCLQCFAPPCEGDEQSMTPLTATLKLCCRTCSRVMESGAACNLERTEPAVVCQENDICSTTKRVCVEECIIPPPSTFY